MLRLESTKTIIRFQISTLKFIKMQSFMQKERTLSLELKIHHLGTLGPQF